MYLEHYQLKRKPFGLTPGTDFLWLGEKHQEALATLEYGVISDLGFLLLTGDVGVGKTALIHLLIRRLDSSTIVAHITDPGLGTNDFFKLLAAEFGIDTPFSSKGEFLIILERFLRQADAEHKKVLLIVDEAQRLNNVLLDQIRVLSNIELNDRKLINIFFIGQPEFKSMLLDPANRAIRQRIAINYQIQPLSESETAQYIQHRLKTAGATRQIFSLDAIRDIYRTTHGHPRAINILCDHALLTGFASGATSVDSSIVRECARELNIREELEQIQSTPPSPQRSSRLGPPAPAPQPEAPPAAVRSRSWGYPVWIGISVVLVACLGYFLLWSPPREPIGPAGGAGSSPPPPMRSPIPVDQPGTAVESGTTAPRPQTGSDGSRKRTPDAALLAEASDSAADLALPSPPPEQAFIAPGGTADAAPRPAVELPSPVAEAQATTRGEPSRAAAATTPPTPAADAGRSAPQPRGATDAPEARPPAAAPDPPPPPPESAPAAATGQAPAGQTAGDEAPSTAATADETDRAVASSGSPQVNPSSPAPAPAADEPPPAAAGSQRDAPASRSAGSGASSGRPTRTAETGPPVAALTDPPTSAPASPPGGRTPPAAADEQPPTPARSTSAAPSPPAAPAGKPSVAPPPEPAAAPGTGTPPPAVAAGAAESGAAAAATGAGPAIPPTAALPRAETPPATASAETPAANSLENRLRSFLQMYCNTYAAKDLDMFSTFFSPDAVENGKPFESLLPKYKRNFTVIESIYYRIELEQFSYAVDRATVTIDGNFFLRWLPPDKQWRENAGRIQMSLKENGASFLVQRLDYHGQASAKE